MAGLQERRACPHCPFHRSPGARSCRKLGSVSVELDCLSTSYRGRWCWSQEEASHQLAGELCPPLSELGGQLPRSEQLARELRPSFPKLGGSLCCRPRSSQEANSGRFGLCRTSSRTHPRQLRPVCPRFCGTRPQQLRSGPAELP